LVSGESDGIGFRDEITRTPGVNDGSVFADTWTYDDARIRNRILSEESLQYLHGKFPDGKSKRNLIVH
jgi:hypothetical protein